MYVLLKSKEKSNQSVHIFKSFYFYCNSNNVDFIRKKEKDNLNISLTIQT